MSDKYKGSGTLFCRLDLTNDMDKLINEMIIELGREGHTVTQVVRAALARLLLKTNKEQ